MGSRLDYANAVLYGVSSKNINCLQRIQNELARCVVDSKVHRSLNAMLQQLHWLPIHQRIDFKLANLCEVCVPCSLICHQFVPELISCPIPAIPYAPLSRYLPARCSQDRDSHWFTRVSRRPFLILFLRTLDRPTIFLYFVAFQIRFISAMPSINTSDITWASDSTYFVEIAHVMK